MNNDIKFLNIEWKTPYPLTNFEDRFGLRASIFLDSSMCGFLFICTLASSQTLVVNKILWLCLVPSSTTNFASDVGYRKAKNE